MSHLRRMLQFRLRTALLLVAVLGICFALLATYLRPPPDEISQEALDRLVEHIKPGMTEVEVTAVFGFPPYSDYQKHSHDDSKQQWTFYLTDQKHHIHGNAVFYVAEFSNGRLTTGNLFYPM